MCLPRKVGVIDLVDNSRSSVMPVLDFDYLSLF